MLIAHNYYSDKAILNYTAGFDLKDCNVNCENNIKNFQKKIFSFITLTNIFYIFEVIFSNFLEYSYLVPYSFFCMSALFHHKIWDNALKENSGLTFLKLLLLCFEVKQIESKKNL